MTKQYYSVAIDGPAGAGKSTMARRAAETLGIVYVDTGAIYRTVAYAVTIKGIVPTDQAAVAALLPELALELMWTPDGVQHMILDAQDVTELIRQPDISQVASVVSAIPSVREFLLNTQRDIAKGHSVIMDGRDIGTVVLPEADVKIFLSASAEVRAKRRWLQLQAMPRQTSFEEVLQEIIERDNRDTNRAIAPLRPAEDAVLLDTSNLTLEESVSKILSIIREKTAL